MTSILFFVIAISLLVGVHEWGHYIVAKRAGVKVLRFSIGFGPKLFSRFSSDTEFCVCLIPLGYICLGFYVNNKMENIKVNVS